MATDLELINKQREENAKEWGGKDHDEKHTPIDWCHYISKQLAYLHTEAQQFRRLDDEMMRDMALDEIRERLIKIAALAMDALEVL